MLELDDKSINIKILLIKEINMFWLLSGLGGRKV